MNWLNIDALVFSIFFGPIMNNTQTSHRFEIKKTDTL